MPNFNVGDLVVDLTNMHKWRDQEEFKLEFFLYEFNKKVLMTDETSFIIKSNYERYNNPVFLPDHEIFSQSTGLNEDKSRVLFNLTPHMNGLRATARKQKTPEELARLNSTLAMESDENMKYFLTSLKDTFLTYFDEIHEEIKPYLD